MHKQETQFVLFLRRLFLGRPQELYKGQVGIYHYVVAIDTIHEDNHGMKYDIYAKVKIIEIYTGLVEVELVDMKINDSASQEVINIVKNNFAKYVNPKYIKWQLKDTQLTTSQK